MNLQQLIATITAHQWLPLLLLLAVYLRALFGPHSKFPITLSPNWRPVFVALFGAAVTTITAEEGGASWGMAAVAGFVGFVAAGAVDGLLVAIWGSAAAAPGWARALVFLVDDIAGGGGSSGSAQIKTPVVPAASSPKPPTSSRMRLLGAAVVAGVLLVLVVAPRPTPPVQRAAVVQLEGCSWFAANKQAVVGDIGQIGSCILSQLFQGQSDPLKIAAACAPATLADVDQIIVSLLNFYTAADGGPPPAAPAGLVDRLVATHERARLALKGAQ